MSKRLNSGCSPTREYKYSSVWPYRATEHKRRRVEKRIRTKERWANDKVYQAKQLERNIRLKRVLDK